MFSFILIYFQACSLRHMFYAVPACNPREIRRCRTCKSVITVVRQIARCQVIIRAHTSKSSHGPWRDGNYTNARRIRHHSERKYAHAILPATLTVRVKKKIAQRGVLFNLLIYTILKNFSLIYDQKICTKNSYFIVLQELSKVSSAPEAIKNLHIHVMLYCDRFLCITTKRRKENEKQRS